MDTQWQAARLRDCGLSLGQHSSPGRSLLIGWGLLKVKVWASVSRGGLMLPSLLEGMTL